MMRYVVFTSCLLLLAFVTERLFRIYNMGRQMYFNFIYKPKYLKTGKAELAASYKRFVFTLWMLEITLAVLTMLSGLVLITR